MARMLKCVAMVKGEVLLCGTCMDVRGMTAEVVMVGARRSSMDDLAAAKLLADKLLVFWARTPKIALLIAMLGWFIFLTPAARRFP